MDSYIHKPTGRIARPYFIANGVQYYSIVGETGEFPSHLLNSEWEVFDFENVWRKLKETPMQWFKKPVVTLQGKDLYEGDEFWYVGMPYWSVLKGETKVPATPRTEAYWRLCFASKELAEQYVLENKPVYPAYWVESLIESARNNMSILRLNGIAFHNASPLIDKLKTFKNENTISSITSPGIEFYKPNC